MTEPTLRAKGTREMSDHDHGVMQIHALDVLAWLGRWMGQLPDEAEKELLTLCHATRMPQPASVTVANVYDLATDPQDPE